MIGVEEEESVELAGEGPDVNPYAVIAATAFLPAPVAPSPLLERILGDPRMHRHADGLLSCVQCGICTSGCPAARFADYSPREISRRARDGDESLLEDDSVWLCSYCYTCQARCPQGNSVAVINQIIRGLQVESGYGLRHVALFISWAEQFYATGIGGWPRQLLDDIADAWGERWWHLVERLDDLREELGVGSLYPSERAVGELRVILDETGFRTRLQMPGAELGR
jgi:heterodisulfide reductase subunit C